MGMTSLLLALAGIITTIIHYANHSIALGVISIVLLLFSFILGTKDMKNQEKGEGINAQIFNPALLGHGASSIVLIVCGIMCIIANVR
ncbi:hypothetical protein [Massiliimalia timonensis]|uniref:hypothetical protein n=1 Tax=Massiliimalia timonensis TaxID=1987501 RepID=UPI00189D18B7|nr:hypothetical protein [Massiliimalia timonensis]